MADIQILKRARAVDEITQDEFRARSGETQLSNPESIQVGEQELHLFYGDSRIDGRVVAARFIEHLAGDGRDYRIARPAELDDPDFNVVAFAKLAPAAVNQVAVASDRKSGTTDLLSYSRGDLQVVDASGKIHYYLMEP